MNVREPAMMSFMSTSLGCWVCQIKKAVLFRGIFLRAVCCSDTQGWLGFPWPPPRGWAKTCATLPWPLRGGSTAGLFSSLLPRQAQAAGAVSRLRRRTERREAWPGRRPQPSYLASSSKEGRTAAAGRGPGERPRAAPPREAPRPWDACTASRSAAHSPANKRPFDLQPGAQRPAGGGGAAPTRCARLTPASRPARAYTPVPRHVQGRRPRSASTEASLERPLTLT